MPDNEEKTVPTITLKLTDPVTFNIEIDLQAPLYCARAMLNEAVQTLQKMINYEEAKQMRALAKPSLIRQ
jgi:hypothetical protein